MAVALRTWRGLLVAGLGLLAVHDLGALTWHGEGRLFDSWLYDGLELLAAAGCLARAVRVSHERAVWLLLGAAILSTATGDVTYDFVYGGNPPFPSLADAFYLCFYPVCYVGIVLLVRRRISRFNPSLWLDGGTAALATGALGASVLLEVIVKSTHGSPIVVLTNLAYPLGDILLLALIAFVFAITGWRPGRAWTLIGAALLLNAIADGVYLYQSATNSYAQGTILDVLWPASVVLIAFSAWPTHTQRRLDSLEGRAVFATPLAFGLVALGVLVYASLREVHPLAVGLATGAVVLVLLRAALTFRENAALIDHSRVESLTDPLTRLGNRRKLMADLESFLGGADAREQLLVIFDLNGFKHYNDSFGHPAGDALLSRLADKVRVAIEPNGTAYRLGGDEFCALIPTSETTLDRAASALHEQGESFTVSSAFGAVALPTEASTPSAALRIADQRLYAHKQQHYTRRGGPHEVLLRTLAEREPELREHLAGVAELATSVGRELGLGEDRLDELRLAAELHDVGKLAIPDAVLDKPGPLNEEEWRFIRQHTLIGERILAGAPALRGVGLIVRSTHERWDGRGYGDGLARDAIPLAARIIAACDAFAAMTSDRPYQTPLPHAAAIAELRRCAGAQFDPMVVDVLCRLLEADRAHAGAAHPTSSAGGRSLRASPDGGGSRDG
jgi:two-component system, cell cycle response regulator